MEIQQKAEIEEIRKQRMIDNLLKDDMKEIVPYLDDDDVTDISIPDSGQLIVTKFNEGVIFTGIQIPPYITERIIKATSSLIGKALDSFTGFPELEGVIPKYNARITGMLPPIVMNPVISIRKPCKRIFTLEDYAEKGYMTYEQYKMVVEYIKDRKNIVVSGATGSGKTTFTNAVIRKMQEFTPKGNFYIIEDNPELQCTADWAHSLWIKQDDAEKAIKTALRFFPTRIIFGEVRDGKVMLELLKSWLTHRGNVTTIHANDGKSTLVRIKSMLGSNAKDISEHLSEVIHLIIHLKRVNESIKVDELYPVSEDTDSFLAGMADNNYA